MYKVIILISTNGFMITFSHHLNTIAILPFSQTMDTIHWITLEDIETSDALVWRRLDSCYQTTGNLKYREFASAL